MRISPYQDFQGLNEAHGKIWKTIIKQKKACHQELGGRQAASKYLALVIQKASQVYFASVI